MLLHGAVDFKLQLEMWANAQPVEICRGAPNSPTDLSR